MIKVKINTPLDPRDLKIRELEAKIKTLETGFNSTLQKVSEMDTKLIELGQKVASSKEVT